MNTNDDPDRDCDTTVLRQLLFRSDDEPDPEQPDRLQSNVVPREGTSNPQPATDEREFVRQLFSDI